jgi:YYY domain-containing protein
MNIVALVVAVGAAGLGGFGLLRRLGLDDFESWAGGRVAGLVAVALPAWWLGVFGLRQWRVAGMAILVVLAVAGLLSMRRCTSWRGLIAAEAVFVIAALIVVVIRLDHPNISHQEKPMDLGIFASLLRAEGFPPPDMWLSGETLPYYYWGALMWTVPISLSGVSLDFAYNLVVGLAGGSVAVLLWALGRRVGGNHRTGLLVAFFGLFAGTPDGVRQLFSGTPLAELDLWHSSRQIADTITEFPLFTFWHGDLHPHLLSMPVACLALLVAFEAGRRGPGWADAAVLSILFGVCWAANPWSMPPTLVSIGLLVLAGDRKFHWPVGEGRRRWLIMAIVGAGGWFATAPFHLGFKPFFDGIGLVSSWTNPGDLFLYGGCLLVPLIAAAIGLLRRSIDADTEPGQAAFLATIAAVLVVAAATGRPTLILLTAVTAVLVAGVMWAGPGQGRPALALAALGTFLFLVPEVIYVADGYGDRLHRMNTVFKSYIQGWVFLAVALPALVHWSVRAPWLRRALVGLMVVLALPHFLGAVLRQTESDRLGLDGLAWMSGGDRAIVEELRRQPPGSVLIEAVGDAYTEYGRLSATSGVPAYLGWANHELVWRGSEINAETGKRKDLVNRLYSSGDPAVVVELAAAAGADLIAVGTLEARDFKPADLAAVAVAGEILVEVDGAYLVRVNRPGGK